MIRHAVLYLVSPDDARAALFAVAGRPVAFRALMAAVRAGARRVGVPAVFRGTELERAIARTPSARGAVEWLEAGSEPPPELTLLVPAAALVSARAAATTALGSRPTTVLAESRAEDAPVVAASSALVRSLWGRIAVGEPVGDALAAALQDGGATVTAGGVGGYRRVSTSAAAREAEALLYANLGSPVDTRVDRALHRRLSRPLTRLAVAAGLSPNTLTAASLLVGLAAAWCFWRGTPGSALAGFVLYAASVVLDHADGEVARLTLAESTLGERLDLVADTVVHALIVLALGFGAERLAGGGAAVLGAVAAVGVVASAVLAKTSPRPACAGGVGAVLHGLSNRNGFYVMLAAFILALALLPSALPVLMLTVAVGMHAFWLGHLVYRLTRRRAESTVV